MKIPFPDNLPIGRGNSLKRTISLLDFALKIKNKKTCYILECGTTRGKYGGGPQGDGWATIAWLYYISIINVSEKAVYSIDISKNNLTECQIICKNLYPNTTKYLNCIQGDSVQCLLMSVLPPLDLVYLDSMDYVPNPITKEHNEINEYSAQHMLNEFLVLNRTACLHDNTLILLDDVGKDFASGKATKIIPFLFKNGWRMLYHDTSLGVNQALFCRDISLEAFEQELKNV